MDTFRIYILLFFVSFVSLLSVFFRVCKRHNVRIRRNRNRNRNISVESNTPPPKYESPPDYQSINIET